ncbi:hypothetical protein HY029_02580 [Candidatus Gottesmanbacteria bacterium]|nr:hypothetical protein [Candidatus Gottesmanbacteria bacterium]
MKIFITRPIPDKYFNLFKKHNFKVDIYEKDEVCPRNILLNRIKGVNAVISQWEDVIDKEFFVAAGKNLKVVANFATGYDYIDLKEAKNRNVVITNTPTPLLYFAAAESALGLLLTIAKRVTKLYVQNRSGNIPEYSPIGEMGLSLRNKVTGIVGMGHIGSKIAEMMFGGFNNRILYFNRTRKKDYEIKLNAKLVSLKKLFSQADFVFITLPKNLGTTNLVNKLVLEKVKSTSILISTSAKEIIDEKTLAKLLKEHRIFGAGLDIYSKELKLLPSDNLILTSHTVVTELDTTLEMTRLCVENVRNVLNGKKPITPVKFG